MHLVGFEPTASPFTLLLQLTRRADDSWAKRPRAHWRFVNTLIYCRECCFINLDYHQSFILVGLDPAMVSVALPILFLVLRFLLFFTNFVWVKNGFQKFTFHNYSCYIKIFLWSKCYESWMAASLCSCISLTFIWQLLYSVFTL